MYSKFSEKGPFHVENILQFSRPVLAVNSGRCNHCNSGLETVRAYSYKLGACTGLLNNTHTRHAVVTAGERDGVFLQVDDDLLDDLLRQQSTLLADVVVGGRHDARQALERRVTDSLVFVFDWQLLGDDVPVQQGRQFAEVSAHVRYVVERDAQLTQTRTRVGFFVSPVFFAGSLTQDRTFGDLRAGFCRMDALPGVQPWMPKHRKKLKVSTPVSENHPPTSSVLHPPPRTPEEQTPLSLHRPQYSQCR